VPASTLSSDSLAAILGELLEAAFNLGGSVSIFACLFLVVMTAVALIAIGSAPRKQRSEISIRVLEVLSRTKHPPG